MADAPTHLSADSSIRKNASVRSRAFGRMPATIEALNSLQTPMRRTAMAEAVQAFETGELPRPQEMGWANVLARTFFSYSADGFSPARLAWEAVIRGLSVIGSLDIDNLGAVGEMFLASDALAIRTTVSLETRVFVQSYSDKVLDCPEEPGIMRAIGAGFARVPDADTPHGAFIANLPARARDRNIAIIAAANKMLTPVTVDYEADVVTSTPAGNATIHHIIAAYVAKSGSVFPEVQDRAVFWADVLGRSPQDAECLLGEAGSLEEALADRIVPGDGSDSGHKPELDYPAVTDFFKAVKAAGAIPCLPWPRDDAETASEPGKLLDDAVNWGAKAVALSPDRFWNLQDQEEKARRMAVLDAVVKAARERCLPVLIGSRMDRPKQKFMDSLDAPELAPYVRDFTDSAFWLYGHTIMERSDGNGVGSNWAKRHFGRDRAAANAFYLEVGKKAKPEHASRASIREAGEDASPGDVLNAL